MLLLTAILALALAACAPTPEPARDPAAPRIYRVLHGDTLATIASKRSTTPEKLRAWNELPDGDPPPGTILLIYPAGTTVPTAPVGTASRPMVINDPDPRPEPPAPAPSAGIAPSPPGLLASDAPAPAPLPAAAPSAPRAGPPGTPALGDRSGLAAQPSADLTSPEIERRPPPSEPKAAWSVGTPGALAPPAPKACLPPPADAPEGGVVTAAGLSKAQIKAAMRPVLAAADSCLAGDGTGVVQVTLEIVAGCDGRARSVMVADTGGAPSGIADCVATVARNATFPAHDDAGGTVFLYPISLRR